MKHLRLLGSLLLPSFIVLFLFTPPAIAQEEEKESEPLPTPAELIIEPGEFTLEVGKKLTLKATVKDADGNELDRNVIFFSLRRRNVGVTPAGLVEAYKAGEHTLIAMVPKDPEDTDRRAEAILRTEIKVTIPDPPVESVTFSNLPSRFYAGTVVPLEVVVEDKSRVTRPDIPVAFRSKNTDVADIDETGNLMLRRAGSTEITAKAEDVEKKMTIHVMEDPVVSFKLEASAKKARTGDVVWFTAVATDAAGKAVPEYPVQFSTSSRPHPKIVAPGAIAQIEQDGAFVAERSGLHTVIAVAGSRSARQTIEITPRDVRMDVEVVGHGAVRDRHTSDLWVWEGADGNDYAITGTWGAEGHAYIWDVTDPKNIHQIDMVKVDARTVNDVKVSEDGAIAVISREGASNRKNGFVLLDVSSPKDGVRILTRYDDQLHGGVHNVFIADGHVYAINNGRRYDIINIEEPMKPNRISRFELDTPGHGIHDVWVTDGIAYSSNWSDGVVAVDVGGGKHGAPRTPKKLGSYAPPNGWNHAAFPYYSKSNGKFYVFVGDEAFPYSGLSTAQGGTPNRAAGWIHVVEWTEWDNPREVARYQVPEAGTHNLWVEDDILYIGYYNGGLRVVDVSGDLRGDLYKQGREIAFWIPNDPQGYVANAPFTWGAQPFKGHIYLSDWNSGLWVVKLVRPERTLNLGEPH